MNDFRYYRPNPFPPVVKNLLIINALVFVAQLILQSKQLTERLMLYPILPKSEILTRFIDEAYGASYYGFQPFQIFTHMFAHSPNLIFHIIFNMLMLWMFGRILENLWGPKRFLFFYLACGLGAAALHLAVQYFRAEQLIVALETENIKAIAYNVGALGPALGASGAVMGIMAAFAYLFPNTELMLIPIPFPIKAKWLVLGYVLLDLFGGFTKISGDNIAHFAHIGGAITGFIIVFIWNKTNRKTLY